MPHKLLHILVIFLLTKSSIQNINNDINDPLQDVTMDIKNDQYRRNMGNMMNNIGPSSGQSKLGELVNGENADRIIQGLGAMASGKGIDPSMISAVMNMMDVKDKNKDDIDLGSLLNMFTSFFGDGQKQSLMDFVPMLMQTYNSFMGPDAVKREKDHENHAWLLPPIVEKIHLMIDHFMNSELGLNLVKNIGAEKFVKIFHDESGRFSYPKFVEMLENHSFRKHWIKMVTDRIALIVSHISDPKTQKKYLTTLQYFINSVLRSQGFPRSALFDISRPVDSLSSAINYFAHSALNINIDSKHYVKPLVEYIQDVFRLAQQKGIVGVNSRELSDKLTDTINMDIIEPIARVNRAYRFAYKNKECDRYVMCLVNQNVEHEQTSLPGLKPLLSKSTSLILSWFLSGHTGTSFWSLYHYITEENNCQPLYKDKCHDFHLEEMKVTTEYVHNEL